MDSTRYTRGQETLAKIHGHIGEGVMNALGDITPDFARFITEFPYGDIYSREGLSPKERQIATIPLLVTLGNAPTEWKWPRRFCGCFRQRLPIPPGYSST